MKKVYIDYIQDILNSLEEIEEFIQGFSFNDFLKDKKTINAVIRSLEVIGEAAKNIPDSVKIKYPRIPWRKMAGMRDKLIHQYFGVDLQTVWQTIKEDLPTIKPLIKKIQKRDIGKV